MSLEYPFPTVKEISVTCRRCGKTETRYLPEVVPVSELMLHLCDDCRDLEASEAADDHMTLDKFYSLIVAESCCHWPTATVAIWWREYTDQNMNGKAISAYDFIHALNLNDQR